MLAILQPAVQLRFKKMHFCGAIWALKPQQHNVDCNNVCAPKGKSYCEIVTLSWVV